jgi:hypothetical protein
MIASLASPARLGLNRPAVHPPLPGIDLPGIFHVRTVPDSRAIREWLEKGADFLAGMSNSPDPPPPLLQRLPRQTPAR